MAEETTWFFLKLFRVWESLFRDKWPGLYENRKHEITKRWKRVYLEELKEMSKQVTPVANYLDSYSFHGSVEIRYYQRAIAMLRSMHFTFEDVQLLMFKPKLNAVLNLVGVHYCIMELGVPEILHQLRMEHFGNFNMDTSEGVSEF